MDNPISKDKVYNLNHYENKARLRDLATGYLVANEVSKILQKK